MSNAPVAVGQNEVVAIATEMLLLDETSERLLLVEKALAAGRISEEEANELAETVQALRDTDAYKFQQEEEQSGSRMSASAITALHRFVWDAPRTIIEDPNWLRFTELE